MQPTYQLYKLTIVFSLLMHFIKSPFLIIQFIENPRSFSFSFPQHSLFCFPSLDKDSWEFSFLVFTFQLAYRWGSARIYNAPKIIINNMLETRWTKWEQSTSNIRIFSSALLPLFRWLLSVFLSLQLSLFHFPAPPVGFWILGSGLCFLGLETVPGRPSSRTSGQGNIVCLLIFSWPCSTALALVVRRQIVVSAAVAICFFSSPCSV